MRAVFDTNVLVRATFSKESNPDRLVKAWQRGEFELVTSPPLLAELDAVLRRPGIQRRLGWTDEETTAFVLILAEGAIVVSPSQKLEVVRDEDDNRVVEAAIEGAADYIVTADEDLLSLGGYAGIQIVTPARLVAVLTASAG